jgi:hypothetical protein
MNISPLHLLTIVFVTLKLTEVIDWSWWLVILPSIIPFGLALLILIITGIVFLVALAYDRYKIK